MNIIKTINGFNFAPLITEKLHMIAELSVTLLRPEEPGDIPNGDIPEDGGTPFYFLLEDDNLITKVSVSTDRLLDKVDSKSEVVLLINVLTKKIHLDYTNLGLA